MLKFNDSKTKFLSLNRQGGVFENYVPSICIVGEIITHHAYYAGTSHDYVSDMIRCYNPSRCLRSESHHLLKQNSFSPKTFGQRSFESAAPILWNDLP